MGLSISIGIKDCKNEHPAGKILICFPKVLNRGLDNVCNVMVVNGIKYLFAVLAEFDNSPGTKHSQLV